LSLEQAKGHFIETIALDDKFDLAHYNLGVVATELSQPHAAESAFLAAIGLNRMRWGPYYGLAQLYFAHERYDDVLPMCGRILRLRRHRAEAYHMRALSYRRSGNVPAAIRDRKAAVRWSWLRLCIAAFRGSETAARPLAATSLRNLGAMRAYEAKRRWHPKADSVDAEKQSRPLRLRLGYLAAAWELTQGAFINSSDAELHFELGKIHAARRKWRRAARRLEKAVELDPDRPRFWIQLARANAGPRSGRQLRAHESRALLASERARARPSYIVDEGFERLKEVYGRLHRLDDVEASVACSSSSCDGEHGTTRFRRITSSRSSCDSSNAGHCGRRPSSVYS
jgi:tetratricopeptide (TPR) repeat protein